MVFSTRQSRGSGRNGTRIYKLQRARVRFRKKYKTWKLFDNVFMKCKIEIRGRKPKRDLDELFDDLTEKEKKDIIKRYWEITKNKNKKKKANKGRELYSS